MNGLYHEAATGAESLKGAEMGAEWTSNEKQRFFERLEQVVARIERTCELAEIRMRGMTKVEKTKGIIRCYPDKSAAFYMHLAAVSRSTVQEAKRQLEEEKVA